MKPDGNTYNDDEIDEMASEIEEIVEDIVSHSGLGTYGMDITTETHISFYDDKGQQYHFIADESGGLRYAHARAHTDVMDDPEDAAGVLALLKAKMGR